MGCFRKIITSKQGGIECLAMNLDMSKLAFRLLWITLGAGNFVPSFLCFAHIIHGGLLCSRSALTVNKALIIADPMYPGVYYMVNLFLKEYVNIKIILDYDGQKCHLIVSFQRSYKILQKICHDNKEHTRHRSLIRLDILFLFSKSIFYGSKRIHLISLWKKSICIVFAKKRNPLIFLLLS